MSTVTPRFINTRGWLVNRLQENLKSKLDHSRVLKILVIGGSTREPELSLFKDLEVEYHFAGIENEDKVVNFLLLDLNIQVNPTDSFDLVICNQVLEHLYNLNEAFNNMAKFVRAGGYLWISCPANNYRHGSPEYFSAGYSKEFLSQNLTDRGFDTLDTGELSSKRIYLYRHLLKLWPTDNQTRFPLIAYYGFNGSLKQKIIFNLKTLLPRIYISLNNRTWVLNGDFPLETFGFFQKLE